MCFLRGHLLIVNSALGDGADRVLGVGDLLLDSTLGLNPAITSDRPNNLFNVAFEFASSHVVLIPRPRPAQPRILDLPGAQGVHSYTSTGIAEQCSTKGLAVVRASCSVRHGLSITCWPCGLFRFSRCLQIAGSVAKELADATNPVRLDIGNNNTTPARAMRFSCTPTVSQSPTAPVHAAVPDRDSSDVVVRAAHLPARQMAADSSHAPPRACPLSTSTPASPRTPPDSGGSVRY